MSMATDPDDSVHYTIGAPSGDDEIDAMRLIVVAVSPLAIETARRVIRWAADRYGVELDQPSDPR
jgi:hypothetical protein